MTKKEKKQLIQEAMSQVSSAQSILERVSKEYYKDEPNDVGWLAQRVREIYCALIDESY